MEEFERSKIIQNLYYVSLMSYGEQVKRPLPLLCRPLTIVLLK